MKYAFKRLMALALVVIMLVPVLSSCGLLGFGTDPGGTSAGPTTPPTTTADPIPVFDRVPITGITEYVIVYPEAASDAVYDAVLALRDAIRDVTGATPSRASRIFQLSFLSVPQGSSFLSACS